jgi:hypothetical protein
MSVLGLRRHEKIVEEELPKSPSAAVERINDYLAPREADLDRNGFTVEPEPNLTHGYLKPEEDSHEAVDIPPELEPYEPPTLPEIYKDAPASRAEEGPLDPTQLEPELTDNASSESLKAAERTIESEVKPVRFDAAKTTRRGLANAVKILRRGREIAATPFNLLDSASQFVSVKALTSLPSLERHQPAPEIDDTDDQEADKDHKKLIKVAGGIGTILLTAAAGYAAYRGYSHYLPNRAHETLQQAVPSKAPSHQPAEIFSSHPPVKFQPDVIQPISSSKHELVQQHAHRVIAKVKIVRESLQFRGDTIWSHVQERVQAKYSNLSEHQRTQLVIKFTRQALRLNPRINQYEMSTGDSFELPAQLG